MSVEPLRFLMEGHSTCSHRDACRCTSVIRTVKLIIDSVIAHIADPKIISHFALLHIPDWILHKLRRDPAVTGVKYGLASARCGVGL